VSLVDDILYLEERLNSINQELKELRSKAEALETQNARLWARFSEEGLLGQGQEALSRLYEDGFHICHAHFAQPRFEECLFCMALLK